MLNQRNIIYASIATLLVIVASYFIFAKNKESGRPPQGPKFVSYIEANPQHIKISHELPGRVVAYQTAEIRPQVTGIIQARLFEEGSFVKEGQQLYQIDPASYEADYQSAEANLENNKAELKNAQNLKTRYKKLIAINAVSKLEYDNAEEDLSQAQAKVNQAEAELKNAKIKIDYTQLHAPISGYIGPSSVTKGALVTSGQAMPLATIRQLDPIYVDLSESPSKAKKIQNRLIQHRQQGHSENQYQVSLFTPNSSVPLPEKGELNVADLAVDASTGSVKLRSLFNNPNTTLLPGMFVQANINDIGAGPKIILPQKAVMINKDGSMSVWKVSSENKAVKQLVQVGESHAHQWVITQGVMKGDKIITEGFMGLREGQDVKAKHSRADRGR